MRNIKILAIVFFSSMFVFVACKQLTQITNTLNNMKRLQFKLENVNGFKLSGINLSNKNSLKDVSISDGLNLASAFKSKKFPAEFVLNVAAKNPNDGTGGSKQTAATLTSLEWTMYIDDVPTISGNIDNPIEVPGVGSSTIIPLRMSLDLYSFFSNKGYEGIFNLALALGGVNGSPAKIKLDAKPTVTTPFGAISYPGRITIIDKQFN